MASTFSMGILYLTTISMTSIPLIVDKKEGLYERSVVSGVTSLEVLSSYILTHVVFVAMQASVILTIAFEVFNMQNNGSILLVIILLLLQGISGMSLGLLISCMCNEGGFTVMLSTILFFPGIAFGGMMWTILSMPDYLHTISVAFPHTLATESMRWISLRGKDLSWHKVWPGFLATIAWIMGLTILSLIVMKFKRF
uniref:ABC-2 type transporter transmembrane domain-containing protein n=1 Tax=Strigamia maritima TaxID=126957 RepID=T1JJ88_STRMM